MTRGTSETRRLQDCREPGSGNAPSGGSDILEADYAFISRKDKMRYDDKKTSPGAVERGGEIRTEVNSDRRKSTMISVGKMLAPRACAVTPFAIARREYRCL